MTCPVAMAMGACVQSAQINGNLTAITWKHAVNSYSLLQEALASEYLEFNLK